jgi:hypothetical protein
VIGIQNELPLIIALRPRQESSSFIAILAQRIEN